MAFAANRDPDFFPVARIESFMRTASKIGRMLDGIGCRIDECHRVRSDRNPRQRLSVGGKSKAVDEQLSLVERAEIGGLQFTQFDDPQRLAFDGIDDSDGIAGLSFTLAPRNLGSILGICRGGKERRCADHGGDDCFHG